MRKMLWDPLALAALNESPGRASAPIFARVLAEMMAPDIKASAIGLPTSPLTQLYAEPAREFIERRGGAIKTGTAARVKLVAGRIECVEADGDRIASQSAVVAAVPWFAIRDLFVGDTTPLDDVLARAQSMQSLPIVTVNLWLDRPILDEPFIGLPGRALQWAFDRQSIVGGNNGSVSLVASGASPLVDKNNDELIASAVDELRTALPNAANAEVRRASVIREPRATFSLALGQPSRPSTITAIDRLFLAGDWTDTGLPATIESAVRSGHKAAAAVTGHM
jgi:hypothetical protein